MGSKMVVPSSRRRSARHDAKAYNRQNQMTKLSRILNIVSTPGSTYTAKLPQSIHIPCMSGVFH